MNSDGESALGRLETEGSGSYPDTGESGDSYDVEIGSIVREIAGRIRPALQLSADRIVDTVLDR